MKNYVPVQCPICEDELIVTDMKCNKCHTHFQGEFHVSKFSKLDEKQLLFVETFIKCRGSIKEMEKELNISYPTVKSRLEDVVKSLGFQSNEKPDEKRKKILESIDSGEMSVEEAINILKK